MPDKKLVRAIESAKRDALGVEEKCQLVGALLKAGRLETALEIPSLHSVVLSVVNESHEGALVGAARRALRSAQYIERRGILGILLEIARRAEARANAPRDLRRQIRATVISNARRLSGAHAILHREAAAMLSDSPPDVAALLRSEDERKRQRGILCVSLCADASYVDAMLTMASDPDTRHAVCLAMISMQSDSSSAVRGLATAVVDNESEPCPARLLQAIEYVRRSRARDALPLLAKIASGGSHAVRDAAERALMFWHEPSDIADRYGRELLRSPDPARRATGLSISLRNAPLHEAASLLQEGMRDSSMLVCLAALRATKRLPLAEDVLLDLATVALDRGGEQVPVAGVALIKSVEDSDRLRLILDSAATSDSEAVRAAAIRVFASNESIAVDWRRRRLAIAAASPQSNVAKQGIFGLLSLDRDARTIALHLVRRLDPLLQADVLRDLPGSRTQVSARYLAVFLLSPSPEVVTAAMAKLTELVGRSEAMGMAITRLHRARDNGAVKLFKLCRAAGKLDFYERLNWLLKRAKSGPLRATLAGLAIKKWKERIGPVWLAERLRDQSEEVRICVARELGKLDLTGCDALVASMLRDPCYWVAKAALDASLKSGLHFETDVLADLVMRPDCDRDMAIIALGRLGPRLSDTRAFAAIMAALVSGDEVVSDIARRVLKRAERTSRSSDPAPDWREMERQIKDLFQWGEEFGRRVLDRPVRVRSLRCGLGLTVGDESRTVKIWVNPVGITMDEPNGEDIVRGLIAHEIGHHAHDIGQPGQPRCRRAAAREGIQYIYDLLIDERLERFMKSIDSGDAPPIGRCLDRLAAYAFAWGNHTFTLQKMAAALGLDDQTLRSEFETGARRGTVSMGPGMEACVTLPMIDALRAPGEFDEFGRFHACFRGGHDPVRFGSPRVRAALRTIPANLRSMSHDEVLGLARKIAACFRQPSITYDRRRQPALEVLAGHTDGTPSVHNPAVSGQRGRTGRPIRGRVVSSAAFVDGRPGRLDHLEVRDLRGRSLESKDVTGFRASIRPHVSALRRHFEQIGVTDHDRPRSRSGSRVDAAAARRAAFLPVSDTLMGRRIERDADLGLALVIDRSGSMNGERIELAKTIALLLAESVSSVPGVEGHVAAFTDRSYDILTDLGRFRRFGAISRLTGEGGNNDAAAVMRAAEMLRASKRSRKVLCMLSDGMPAECTVEQLREQVRIAETRHGIRCVQIAVAPIFHIGFTEFIDVSTCELGDAVKRIAGVLASLAAGKPVRSDDPVSMEEYRSKEIERIRRMHETAQEGVKM